MGTSSLVIGIAFFVIGIILFFFTLYVHAIETIFDEGNEVYFIIAISIEVGSIGGGAASISNYLKDRKKEKTQNS